MEDEGRVVRRGGGSKTGRVKDGGLEKDASKRKWRQKNPLI